VRAKISTVSLKASIPETKAGLTIRSEGLGKVEWLEEASGEKPKEKKEEKLEVKKNERGTREARPIKGVYL
jgi:hypothetical protein